MPGASWTIIDFSTAGGKKPVREYIKEELNGEEKGKLYELISRLAKFGPSPEEFTSSEMKRIQQGSQPNALKLYELRVANTEHNPRVLFAAVKDRNILLLHAFTKTSQQTPEKDVDLAIRRYKQFALNRGN